MKDDSEMKNTGMAVVELGSMATIFSLKIPSGCDADYAVLDQ